MSKTSNPQKRRRSSQNRPTFVPNLAAGGTGVDLVSGVAPATSISGTRYGIVNNTVTQFEVNQIPIEDDGLRGCPAFTQLATYTEDISNAAWGKTGTKTPIRGNDYQGKFTWDLIEDTSIGFHRVFYTSVGLADNVLLGFRGIFKSSNRGISITIRDKTNTNKATRIDLSNGSVGANANTYVNVTSLGNGFYACFVASPVASGATTPLVLLIRTKDGVETYTGDDSSFVTMAQPSIVNFGVTGIPFIPPYVPNNTTGSISVVSEAATATTGTSFDLDDVKLARLKTALRGPNAQGHLELTFKSNIDSGWLANGASFGVLTNRDVLFGLLYYAKDTNTWRAYDGTNVAQVTSPISLSPSAVFKISIDWGTYSTGQKMRITVNGVRSALANFSGSFGTQDLRFFFGNTAHAGWIVKDSLKVMDRPQW